MLSTEKLVAGLDKRKCCQTVRERVLRLNKTFVEGKRIRGWHRKETYRNNWSMDAVGKGEFIRRWGRVPWSILHKDLKHKNGRREYVAATTFQDMPASLMFLK